MSGNLGTFYVSYVESLVVSLCGFLLLSGVFHNNQDYSSLQQWALETQIVFFSATLLVQVIWHTLPPGSEFSRLLPLGSLVADAYCFLCSLIFVVLVLMFSRSMVSEQTPISISMMLPLRGMWYFHPHSPNSTHPCEYPGTWKETVYKSSSNTCLGNQTDWLRNQFPDNTNGTLYYQSERSDTVQLVSGNSYAASQTRDRVWVCVGLHLADVLVVVLHMLDLDT
jgi:hypothetical protein